MAEADDVPAVRAEPSGVTPASLSALLARRLPGYARLVAAPPVPTEALAFPEDVLADRELASQVAANVAPPPRKSLRI